MNNINDSREGYIQTLEEFKRLLNSYRYNGSPEARTAINKKSNFVQKLVRAAHAFKTMTIAPPPAVGGMIMQDVNPFDLIFKEFPGLYIIEHVVDIIDETIGYIEHNKDFTLQVLSPVQDLPKQLANKNGVPSVRSSKETSKILGMSQEAFWPLLVAVIGATFYIGFLLGQTKFDKEKIDLYNSNQYYKTESSNLSKELSKEQQDTRYFEYAHKRTDQIIRDSLKSVEEQLHDLLVYGNCNGSPNKK